MATDHALSGGAKRAERTRHRYDRRMQQEQHTRKPLRLLAALALTIWLTPAPAQLRIYGNTTTLELAPVLLAAQDLYGSTAAVQTGGIPDLFDAEAADLATNAETQALRQSVDHPDLRTILTVAEGFYRIVARRSAGIT